MSKRHVKFSVQECVMHAPCAESIYDIRLNELNCKSSVQQCEVHTLKSKLIDNFRQIIKSVL